MPRAVILTALSVEYQAVQSHLTDLEEKEHPLGTLYEQGDFTANGQVWNVGIAQVGAGNTGAAVETERAIAYFQPDILLFVGIAGGIKDVAIGDVVVATDVYGYESGKMGDQFLTRPTLGKSHYALVQRAIGVGRKEEWLERLKQSSVVVPQPRVFVAPIAAGEKVLASKQSEVFQLLRNSYNSAIAVEMEGYGFLNAAFAHSDIKAIVIRGISDLVEGKNDDSPASKQEPEQIRQEKAARHASAFAFEILSKLKISDSSRNSSYDRDLQQPAVENPVVLPVRTESKEQTATPNPPPVKPPVEKIVKPVTGPDAASQSEPPLRLSEFPFTTKTVVEVTSVLGFLNKQVVTKTQDKKAKQHLEDLNGAILHMVSIPGDSFVMGAHSSEAESGSDERPQHAVTVKPFLMGKFPVTQEQWRVVANFPLVKRKLDPNPSHFKGDNLPVEQVSWYDAIEFCARLSLKTKRKYRLPSEAEWEYACRAGTSTPFYFGETITPDLVNYNGNYPYGAAPKGEYRHRTTPVGSFPPNQFGLYDMHGNVWEWCADHWHGNYKEAPSDGSAWLTNNEEASRLCRGGSWYFYSRVCRSACRLDGNPDGRVSLIGFRVVCFSAWTL